MQADIWSYLAQSKKPILLYGMGNGADLIIERLSLEGVGISGVFASDGDCRQEVLRRPGTVLCSQSVEK